MPATRRPGVPPAARWRAARTPDKAFAIALCAVLAGYNNLFGLHPWHGRRYARVNGGATGAVLAAAAAAGLSAGDLGIGRGRWLPGRLGTALAATVAGGWLVIALVPATRPLLGDKRGEGLDRRDVAYQALLRIPVGTALWEETAFRGVLQAALRRVLPDAAAIAATSGVFGVWHIRPTVQALRANGLAGQPGQAVTRVAAGVAATTAGGLLFSWLRARSGRLAAPVLLHVTTNSGALVTAALIRSRRSR